MDVTTTTQRKDEGGVRRNKCRPTMQLYVPPARRERQKKIEIKTKQEKPPPGKKSSDSNVVVVKAGKSSTPVDAAVKLKIQDAPSLVVAAVGGNQQESEIINGKSEKDCVLSAPLSKDEVS